MIPNPLNPPPRLVKVQRHETRGLFRSFWGDGMEGLRSLDDIARILMSAPPEWSFLTSSTPVKAEPGDLKGMRQKAWYGFVGEHVRDYLWLVPAPFMFDLELAGLLFQRIKRRIEHGSQRRLRLTPLIGLAITGPGIELSPQLRLRPLTPLERNRWLNQDDSFSDLPLRRMEILGLQSLIEFAEPPEALTINFGPDRPDTPEAAVLAALNLIHEPQAGVPIHPAFTEQLEEGSIHEYVCRRKLEGPKRSIHGLGMTLQAGDIERLVNLVSRIQHLMDGVSAPPSSAADRSLAIALSRWLMSYTRESHKDWLIDCWVALEGLFTQRGESSLTRKCAERISRELASFGLGTVDALYAEIKASYECRCEIVHGERDPRKDSWVAAVRTREYLRKILYHRLIQSAPARANLAPIHSARQ
ncbi:HEPN domain-containing protein [Corallococcus llansteffanensis]|uniref:HEPN domain-containing protein n=1 Tax=Corallococcus llansteffanensis TaxID=2316731 RepID=UPI0011C3A2C1|nr:HEPN domain-containing protein [Corallococcus llansteffanensis]